MTRMVDNDIYQSYVLKLVREGHDALTDLDNLLKSSSEYGKSVWMRLIVMSKTGLILSDRLWRNDNS